MPERLTEQAVPPIEVLVVDKYKEFLRRRAGELAKRATAFLQSLAQE